MEFSMKLTQEYHLEALKEQNFGLLLIALCEHLSAQKIENFIHWDHSFAQDVKVEIDVKFFTPTIDFVEKEIRLVLSWLFRGFMNVQKTNKIGRVDVRSNSFSTW